jgi:hypothetical protein
MVPLQARPFSPRLQLEVLDMEIALEVECRQYRCLMRDGELLVREKFLEKSKREVHLVGRG